MSELEANQEQHDEALPLEVLVPLPSLIKGLSILLNERCNFCPQLCSLARQKILAQEGFGEHLLSSE